MPLRTWLVTCSRWIQRFPPQWLAARSLGHQSLGKQGEDFAARYLKRLGYHIVGRQVDLRVGELDIIAVDGRTVVFVEVKTRSTAGAGTPAEAVDDLRQERMTRAALAYLKSHGLLEYSARFDVIALTWPDGARQPTLEHSQNAFPATGRGQFFS
jgi:putative endonuclease